MNSSRPMHRQQTLVGESGHVSFIAFNSPYFTSHVLWNVPMVRCHFLGASLQSWDLFIQFQRNCGKTPI